MKDGKDEERREERGKGRGKREGESERGIKNKKGRKLIEREGRKWNKYGSVVYSFIHRSGIYYRLKKYVLLVLKKVKLCP
jgi:hypothetical protein